MEYIIVYSKKFRKKIRILTKSGALNIGEKLNTAIEYLKSGRDLHISFKDHSLKGNMQGYREFHLSGDLVVVYEVDERINVITFTAIGSHSEIF